MSTTVTLVLLPTQALQAAPTVSATTVTFSNKPGEPKPPYAPFAGLVLPVPGRAGQVYTILSYIVYYIQYSILYSIVYSIY